MRPRTARRQLQKETPRWQRELVSRMVELGAAQQFGTMLEELRTASRTHGVPYEELGRTIARLAIDLGLVQPLPVEIPTGGPPLND